MIPTRFCAGRFQGMLLSCSYRPLSGTVFRFPPPHPIRRGQHLVCPFHRMSTSKHQLSTSLRKRWLSKASSLWCAPRCTSSLRSGRSNNAEEKTSDGVLKKKQPKLLKDWGSTISTSRSASTCSFAGQTTETETGTWKESSEWASTREMLKLKLRWVLQQPGSMIWMPATLNCQRTISTANSQSRWLLKGLRWIW